MPNYRSVGPGLPDVAVEVAFASLPTDATQVWSDVTPYVRELGIRRGRNNELARIEAGTLDLLLDNRTARFNPENTSSPYYPNVLPKKQVRVLARSGATTSTLFTGFTGGFPQEWPGSGTDALVRLGATDLLGLLARARLGAPPRRILSGTGIADATTTAISVSSLTTGWPSTSFPYTVTVSIGSVEDMSVTSETPGAGPILNVVRGVNGTTAAPHMIAPTDPTAWTVTLSSQYASLSGQALTDVITNSIWQGLTVPGGWFANVAAGLTTVDTGTLLPDANVLEIVQQITDSEAGLFYAGVDGLPVFHDRHYRISQLTPAAAFGEVSPEILYQDVAVSHDEQQLYNDIVLTTLAGQKLAASDATSQTVYWPQTLSRSTIGGAGPAQDFANYLLSRFKDPVLRAPDLVLDGHNVPGATLIGLDIDQRYTVKRRPTSGTIISKDVFVEGVSHTLAPASWTTSLSLGNADREKYWIIGTSQLGVDTKLAF